jgi:hypothetical protein
MATLFCKSNSAVQRRYTARMWAAAGLCVLFAIGASLAFRLAHLKGLPAYPVAVLPALPILWALWETGRYLAEEKDEFLRSVLVQCLLGGIGGVLALTTVWGYLEDFAGIGHLDPIWVYPLFWFCAAFTYPLVRARYR